MLVAAAGIQYVQAQHLGLTGNLCRSSQDLPLCLQLLGTAGWVKAELSSSSQGYTRLPASRCVPASARGREVGAGALGRVQGFRGVGLKALAGMAKHSALEPPHPYSAGRTHRLHDGELSPSNTPLPVGNPQPTCSNIPWLERAQPAGTHAACWGWQGWRGRQVCLPAACLQGRPGLPAGSPAPQTPPGVWGMPEWALEHPLQHRALRHAQLQEAAELPAAFQMLFLQIVAVQMHLCIFPSRPPSPLHPPHPARGDFCQIL